MKVPDTAIAQGEFKIDLKNPEKTFTNKQLWDAFVNAQTKLDEAVALLKDAKNHWGDYAPQGGNARKTFNQIDEFLSEVKDG